MPGAAADELHGLLLLSGANSTHTRNDAIDLGKGFISIHHHLAYTTTSYQAVINMTTMYVTPR
eukprot:17359-Heterococcus_DN1.PRE.3